jgi:gamma-glutamylaminecyclotransferase
MNMHQPVVFGQDSDSIKRREEDWSKSHRLFVYGTLKRGFNNHNLLERAKFIGECDEIQGVMFHLGGFPSINLVEPRTKLFGEIYEVTLSQLGCVDSLEGHPRWYKRTLLYLPKGLGYTWTYVYPKDLLSNVMKWVPTGRWEGSETPSEEWTGFGKGWHPGPSNSSVENGGVSKFTRVPCESCKEPGWFYLVNQTTGEANGPYRIDGEYLGKDGKVKPRIVMRKDPPKSIHEVVRGLVAAEPPKTILSLPAPIVEPEPIVTFPSLAGPGLRRI